MSHSPLLLVFPYISLIRLLLRLTHFVVRLHLCFLGLQPVAVVLVLPWSSIARCRATSTSSGCGNVS